MTRMILATAWLTVAAVSAQAAHIVTETRSGDTPVRRTDTYANPAGDLRIDERGYRAEAGAVAASGSAGSAPPMRYTPGDIDDTTIYQTNGRAIVSLEGEVCRRMTADSAPPPGFGGLGGNMAQVNEQMAAAMQQANAAMEQAMKDARREGMTAEQERAMRQYTRPFMDAPSAANREALRVEKMNERVRVGRYTGEGYRVLDGAGNVKHRLWVVPTGELAGSGEIRRAMRGMLDTYAAYLDKMGAGALMDTGLSAVLQNEALADTYPVRVEDLETGEVTDVVEAGRGDAGVAFYPECVEKDMFGG